MDREIGTRRTFRYAVIGLLGVTKFSELDKSYVHPATATNMPSVFSAYPLLDMEPYRY